MESAILTSYLYSQSLFHVRKLSNCLHIGTHTMYMTNTLLGKLLPILKPPDLFDMVSSVSLDTCTYESQVGPPSELCHDRCSTAENPAVPVHYLAEEY